MKIVLGAVALSALLLSGCAMLPGQGDYAKLCSGQGAAERGELYKVTAVKDFWLTSAGNYLSDTEYAQTSNRVIDSVSGMVSQKSSSPDVRVRVFAVHSLSSQGAACLPTLTTDKNYSSMTRQLTVGRKLKVYGESSGLSGTQIYNHVSQEGFRYRVL